MMFTLICSNQPHLDQMKMHIVGEVQERAYMPPVDNVDEELSCNKMLD